PPPRVADGRPRDPGHHERQPGEPRAHAPAVHGGRREGARLRALAPESGMRAHVPEARRDSLLTVTPSGNILRGNSARGGVALAVDLGDLGPRPPVGVLVRRPRPRPPTNLRDRRPAHEMSLRVTHPPGVLRGGLRKKESGDGEETRTRRGRSRPEARA